LNCKLKVLSLYTLTLNSLHLQQLVRQCSLLTYPLKSEKRMSIADLLCATCSYAVLTLVFNFFKIDIWQTCFWEHRH